MRMEGRIVSDSSYGALQRANPHYKLVTFSYLIRRELL
jgi:hypothetical protein